MDSSERSPDERAILLALARLVGMEGSVAAVARAIGFRRARVARWLAAGRLPPELLADRRGIDQLLSVLYTLLARWDVDEPRREARDRRLKRSKDAGEIVRLVANTSERKRFFSELCAWVRRFDEIARFRRLKKTGATLFAAELGMRPSVIRAAVEKQEVGPKLYVAYRDYQNLLSRQQHQDERDQDVFLELMTLAEAHQTRTGSMYGGEEPRPVYVKNEDHRFGGDGTAGWQWKHRIHAFALPTVDPSGKDAWALVQEMAAFVRGITPLDRRQYPEWIVLANASVLMRDDVFGHRRPKMKSGKDTIRMLGPQESNAFVIQAVHSSGACVGSQRGVEARERAVRAFIGRMGETLDGSYLMFIQGVVGWQFRRRTAKEMDARYAARRAERAGVPDDDFLRARVVELERARRRQRVATRSLKKKSTRKKGRRS